MTEILQVKLEQNGTLPQRKTKYAAGIDMYVNEDDFDVKPGEIRKVSFGFSAAIPAGHVGLMVIRSGHGAKGVALANAVGIIDSDYRGVWMANLINNNPNEPVPIKRGERIAQVVLVPYASFPVVQVAELDETERGAGGFGHSGRF